MTRERVVDSVSPKSQRQVGAAESATPTSINDEIIIRLDIHIRRMPNSTQQKLDVSLELSLRS